VYCLRGKWSSVSQGRFTARGWWQSDSEVSVIRLYSRDAIVLAAGYCDGVCLLGSAESGVDVGCTGRCARSKRDIGKRIGPCASDESCDEPPRRADGGGEGGGDGGCDWTSAIPPPVAVLHSLRVACNETEVDGVTLVRLSPWYCGYHTQYYVLVLLVDV
jgi:hypothetical protein